MQQLSTLDVGFLHLESPQAHMHIGWLALVDLPAGGRLDLGRLRRQVEGRLHHAPRFRQRLAHVPLGLGEPFWVDDQTFRIERHVREATTGGPVSTDALQAVCDAFLGRALDRSRPLWEILVVSRVAGAGAAVLGKVHHAMVDGVAAVELGMLLFDDAVADGPGTGRERWAPAPPPSTIRLAAHAGRRALGTPAHAAVSVARAPRRSLGGAERALRAASSLGGNLARPAPGWSLNADIGPERTLRVERVEQARLERVKARHRVKLNDVVLAAAAGALHSRGRRMPLRAMVPVNVRGDGAAGAGGNRIALAFVDLPLEADDPVERLMTVAARMDAVKRSGATDGAQLLMGALSPLPSAVKGVLARRLASPRTYNLAISNVPGPTVRLYVAGGEVREIYPVIPLSAGHALSLGVFTYRGGAHFSWHADPGVVQDAGELPGLLACAVDELDSSLPARGRGRRLAA